MHTHFHLQILCILAKKNPKHLYRLKTPPELNESFVFGMTVHHTESVSAGKMSERFICVH